MSVYGWMTWLSIAVLVFGSSAVFLWFLWEVRAWWSRTSGSDASSPD
ncbi:MAG: hypothetical protein KC645_06525 [Gemmatimonadetes bacterium]|nr:hypothetical protein [Gemmatimonadota bacterium]